jgi:hypothetical protein
MTSVPHGPMRDRDAPRLAPLPCSQSPSNRKRACPNRQPQQPPRVSRHETELSGGGVKRLLRTMRVAVHLVDHLDANGFVVMKKPPIGGYALQAWTPPK